MAKVTISIEGTPDEVTEYMKNLIGGKAQQLSAGVSWLPDEIGNLYESVKPEAKRVLREVAANPSGYDRDDLISRLGITGKGLAGRLSSVEFGRKRLFPSKPRPLELNRDTWKYEMLPEVAEWISENAGS